MPTATSLAADPYALGVAVGALLPLALGVALLVAGLRQRRAVAAPSTTPGWSYSGPATPTAAPLPQWQQPVPLPAQPGAPAWPIPPTEPVPSRGTWLIVGGAVLIVLSLLGGLVQAANLATTSERRVALPASVVGLQRDDAASAQIADAALENAPSDLIDPHAALYGTPGLAILVIAARAHTSFPSRQLDSFRKGFEGSGNKLVEGHGVDTGKLGGAARCWKATVGDTHPAVCVFVDRGSLVATIDFLPGDAETAAKRGLQIREATVHKT